MRLPLALAAVSLIGAVAARICKDINIQLNITAQTGIFDIPTLVTNSDATTFIQNVTQQGRNFTEIALAGYKTTAGTYCISTHFCAPSEDLPADPTVQILTHGLGFDKR